MSKRKKAPATKSSRRRSAPIPTVVAPVPAAPSFDASARYAEACELAALVKPEEARRIYAEWQGSTTDADHRLRALVHNDLAVMAVMDGRVDEARVEWKAALEVDQDCLVARLNRDLVEAEISLLQSTDDSGEMTLVPEPLTRAEAHPALHEPRSPGSVRLVDSVSDPTSGPVPSSRRAPVSVAILSFLALHRRP